MPEEVERLAGLATEGAAAPAGVVVVAMFLEIYASIMYHSKRG